MRAVHFTLAAMLAVSFLCALPRAAQGQDQDLVKRLTTRVSSFFDNLNDEEVQAEKAFNDLLALGPLEGREEVKKLVERVAQLDETYGKFLEAEAIGSKQIGKDLVLLKFLYKTEKYPLVWYVTFYRAPLPSGDPNPWVVVAVRFDTRLELLGL